MWQIADLRVGFFLLRNAKSDFAWKSLYRKARMTA